MASARRASSSRRAWLSQQAGGLLLRGGHRQLDEHRVRGRRGLCHLIASLDLAPGSAPARAGTGLLGHEARPRQRDGGIAVGAAASCQRPAMLRGRAATTTAPPVEGPVGQAVEQPLSQVRERRARRACAGRKASRSRSRHVCPWSPARAGEFGQRPLAAAGVRDGRRRGTTRMTRRGCRTRTSRRSPLRPPAPCRARLMVALQEREQGEQGAHLGDHLQVPRPSSARLERRASATDLVPPARPHEVVAHAAAQGVGAVDVASPRPCPPRPSGTPRWNAPFPRR